ncbi:hypothetical protein VTJ04DRAFT_1797 [Mycothermus thermophilus]|uniref:uncharacterized protein n=1 Tax=Humicola insolens TaxID=85995 RepID=UPI00374230B7
MCWQTRTRQSLDCQNPLVLATAAWHLQSQLTLLRFLCQDIAFKTFDDALKLLQLIQINSAQSLNDILGAIRAAASYPNLTSADDDKLITSIEGRVDKLWDFAATCDKWILKEIQKHGLDPELRRPKDRPNREPEAYHYWRERLVRLSDAFEKTKPQSPIGWLYDRRDMGQWWNYWLIFTTLALTVIFGLLQSIAGIKQAWGESSKD